MLAAKRLIQKAVNHHHHHDKNGSPRRSADDVDIRVDEHYGVPSTGSLLAVDSVQRLLAVATLDGRIKVFGGEGIEGLLVSPKQSPYKYIEFLQNQGFLVAISLENEIQVWNLESRWLTCCLQWECNIMGFSVICGSPFMYIGDEYGLMSVLKFDAEDAKLLRLPYHIPPNSLKEAAGFPSPDHTPIVGILSQPFSSANRVLVAYENGLLILWDVYDSRILFVGGGKDLQLMDGNADQQSEVDTSLLNDASYDQLQEKEITALCWASSSGSILAVGYVDGDILFWKAPTASSSKAQENKSSSSSVVKLQLASAERRLPVIVLHWSASKKSRNGCDGQLFIYGGDEIGSEEVLTILSLEWSSGMEILGCAGRVDVTLTGSFADMILLPTAGPGGVNHKTDLFVLTNPGQLHLYDDDRLSTLLSQPERKVLIIPMEFPVTLPASVEPAITVTKLISFPKGGNSLKVLSQIASDNGHHSMPMQAASAKWPLTGGVPSQISLTAHTSVERVYLSGYQDGFLRLWNATCPFFSLICIIEGKLEGVDVSGLDTPVSELDLCPFTLSLAVGNESGLVRIYNLNDSSGQRSFSFVIENKHEVRNLPEGKGLHCKAVLCLLNSPIRALRFSSSGTKLAIGFECGRLSVLETSSLSILFYKDCTSGSSSPVLSVAWKGNASAECLENNTKYSKTNGGVNPVSEVMFCLTKDATLNIIDSSSGSMINSRPWHPKKKSIAITMYIIDGFSSASSVTYANQLEECEQEASAKSESVQLTTTEWCDSHSSEQHSSALINSLILLCCEDSVRMYLTKKVIQGNHKAIRKVKHVKPCIWTSPLKMGDRFSGLVLLFQTGEMEIRSLPDLDLVKENSLTTILRWKLQANMERMITSDHGQIVVANGCELVFMSLLSGESSSRIPEALPCLHDKVLAAAADAAFSVSSSQKKKQGSKPRILGGIVQGFRGRTDHQVDIPLPYRTDFSPLDDVFSKPPFPESLPTVDDNAEEVPELSIDDIEIDEPPLPPATGSPHDVKLKKKGKTTEREQLLGTPDDIQPRLRTPEEIMAQYRKAGDASSVASQTRNKLAERGQKLENINRRTAELQSGAEDFASLANELVKVMENRKWWQV